MIRQYEKRKSSKIRCILQSSVNMVIHVRYTSHRIRFRTYITVLKLESPAFADKPPRHESMPKLLQFDVLTTLSLTILVCHHSFSCYCVRNLRNPAKFSENSNLYSSRSSKVIDLGVNRKLIYDFLLVINSNFARISYRFRDIDAFSSKITCFPPIPCLTPPSGGTP